MARKDPKETREDDVVTRAKRKIQRQIEQAEREHRNKLLRRRIELATAGVRAYENGRVAEAVQNYQAYLKILEDWKGVGSNGLNPSLFDSKKDLYELLLITAVYWDLAKLYDRTHSAPKQREFHVYLEKYLLFSKGAAFQPLSAETLRKYVQHEKAIHKADYRNAYKLLSGDQCFIATSLVDVIAPGTLSRLRGFRDEILLTFGPGRRFVRWYYRNGPGLADRCSRLPEPIRKLLGFALDRMGEIAALILIVTRKSQARDNKRALVFPYSDAAGGAFKK